MDSSCSPAAKPKRRPSSTPNPDIESVHVDLDRPVRRRPRQGAAPRRGGAGLEGRPLHADLGTRARRDRTGRAGNRPQSSTRATATC